MRVETKTIYMKNKFLSAIGTIVLVATFFQSAAQNYDTVKIITHKVTEKIFTLEGDGGNIGVLTGNDGTIIIDDQFAPLSEKIKTALKALNDKPVRFVINTHFHGDHSGGNENFGKDGAVIIAQDNSRSRMTTEQFIAAFNSRTPAAPYDALPKVTFTESVTLHLNGETLQVMHVSNAHTDGDAIIFFKESNVIHTGDVYVRYGLPFIDQPHGGSIDGMIKGTDQIIALANDVTKIIPGHGAIATKKDLIEYRAMLQTLRDRIAGAMSKGKTLTEIIASAPTKEYPAVFDRSVFITLVYDSLKK